MRTVGFLAQLAALMSAGGGASGPSFSVPRRAPRRARTTRTKSRLNEKIDKAARNAVAAGFRKYHRLSAKAVR